MQYGMEGKIPCRSHTVYKVLLAYTPRCAVVHCVVCVCGTLRVWLRYGQPLSMLRMHRAVCIRKRTKLHRHSDMRYDAVQMQCGVYYLTTYTVNTKNGGSFRAHNRYCSMCVLCCVYNSARLHVCTRRKCAYINITAAVGECTYPSTFVFG